MGRNRVQDGELCQPLSASVPESTLAELKRMAKVHQYINFSAFMRDVIEAGMDTFRSREWL